MTKARHEDILRCEGRESNTMRRKREKREAAMAAVPHKS